MSRWRAPPRLLPGAALCAALAGCHPRLPPPDLSLDPATLLEEVKAAQARVRTVQGKARVGVESPQGGGATDQFIVAEKPARVRVEAFDFFGNLAAALAVDGDQLTLYDARQKVFYRGPATPENVARLVPVPLAPEALATLLTGSAPLLPGAAAVSAEAGDGVVRLTLRAGALTQRLEVGPGAALRSSRLTRQGPGGAETPDGLQVDLTAPRTRAGIPLPTDTTAREPAARVELSLRWRELTVNDPVDAALFRLAPPKGARVVDLEPAHP